MEQTVIEVTSRLEASDVAFALMKKTRKEATEFIMEIDDHMQDVEFTKDVIFELIQTLYRDLELPEYDEFMVKITGDF